MATVYSLICFGGRDGKAVVRSSNDLQLTNHGLRVGTKVRFTGTPPGGLSTGTTYYVISAGLTRTAFRVSATLGGSAVTLTSAGTSPKVISEFWATFDTNYGPTYGVDKTRYGTAGSERCYDSLESWLTARAGANPVDDEVCEIGMAWTDFLTTTVSGFGQTFNLPSASTLITPTINGVLTDGWNQGLVSTPGTTDYGYAFTHDKYYCNGVMYLLGTRITVDGISAYTSQVSGQEQNSFLIRIDGAFNTVKNCVAVGTGNSAGARVGFYGHGNTFTIENCIAIGFTGTGSAGFQMYDYFNAFAMWANNLAVGCTVGFKAESNVAQSPTSGLWFYNNISIGNTTNWSTFNSSTWYQAGYNYGLAADTPWYKTTDNGITIATTDFANYAGNDFTPANSSSPQVDSGVTIAAVIDTDITGAERPNYNNGGAEAWDGGPYEFDHGYTRPQTRNLVIPTLVSGSQVQIFTTGTTTALTGSTEGSGTSLTQDMGADMTVDVTIMKVGRHPIRIAGIVLDSETYTLTVDQEIDRTYAASSGLTYTTNATIDRASKEVAINADTTVQNFRNFCIEQWIDKGASGEALANLDFPFSVNGPNSVTFENGWVWEDWGGGGTGSASIARLSRDGMRYLNTSGNVVKAWCAVYTPDTTAGLQVKIEQVNGGSIVSADNTGPVDQLVQIISDPNGDGSYGDGYNYTGHLQMRVQSVGYTKPLADVYATFGTLEDQLYSIGLAPTLNYATTNSDPGGMTFNNGTKAAALTASRSVLQLYQGAQWWTNQDAQWDADVPLAANTSGTTFTLYTGWTLSGMNYITGTQTIAGGTITLAGPATYTPTFSANTAVVAQGEGTYVLNASSTNITFAPTANGVTYVMGDCVFGGTINFHNTHATRAITIEVPSGTSSTTSTAGGTVTVTAPQVYQSVTITGAVAGSRIQIYDTTSSTELYNGTPTFPYTWTDGTPAAATRAIRLRVAKQSTTTAKLFIDANIGTCATSGAGKDVSYLVSQEDDDTYNTNAIDGSGVTDITIAVSGGDRVKIAKAGGSVTWASIYAYQVYWQFTATGIAQETAFIEAPDTANYLLTDFDVKNTHATVPLTITGGWGRDAVTGLSKDIIDTTGTNIYMAPDHVIPYSTGSGLTAGQAAELTAAASSSATAASAAADAETAASAAETAATLARKLLSNKRVIDTATGTETLYDDNGTALYTRLVYEDAAGSTAYDGTAAPHRVEKYT